MAVFFALVGSDGFWSIPVSGLVPPGPVPQGWVWGWVSFGAVVPDSGACAAAPLFSGGGGGAGRMPGRLSPCQGPKEL